MKIDVVPLPRMLKDEYVRDRVVVVFDVLRATTTIAAALAAGAKEIRVFDSLDGAKSAWAQYSGEKLLCGESKCLPPPGFDLGNSPGACKRKLVQDKTLFLATTNGTRALVAARRAELLLTGALVNAAAVANVLRDQLRDVTLLCAGTDGAPADEDLIGAGAVVAQLATADSAEQSQEAVGAQKLFEGCKDRLTGKLQLTPGGQNVANAGLPEDISFAAQLNAINLVPRCDGYSMTIRPMQK